MKSTRLFALLLCLFCLSIGIASADSFRLVFSETDAGQVLKALSRQTGTNMVYSVQEEIPITIDVTASSSEQALRSIVSAAGLSYRRVGSIFIVAKAEDMRKALEPFAYDARFTLQRLTPGEAKQVIEEAAPHVSVRTAGHRIMARGIPEDIVLVRNLLNDYESQLLSTETEIVPLGSASTDQIVSMLNSLVPSLRVTAVQGGEGRVASVSLTGPRADIEKAKRLINSVDVAPPPAEPEEFFVYEVRYSSAPVLKSLLDEALPLLKTMIGPENYTPMQPNFRPLSSVGTTGSSGGSSGGSGGLGQGTRITYTGESAAQPFQRVEKGDRAKHLILQGTPTMIGSAQKLLSKVDVKPYQVLVEVRVVDVSPEKFKELGFDWSWNRFQIYETQPNTTFENTQPAGSDTFWDEIVSKPTGFGVFSRIPWQIDTILRGMETRSEAKILAKPSIQVLDNDEASIFIGDTLRVQLSSVGGLGAVDTETQEFPVGIILLIRPRVNVDGNITLRVHPQVSTITSIDSDSGLPQTSSREADTTVMVKDGETVVIGGLIREEEIKSVREVPLLSQIPLIGELFRSRTNQSRKSEVLVFITTRIVDDMGDAHDVAPEPEPEAAKPAGGE